MAADVAAGALRALGAALAAPAHLGLVTPALLAILEAPPHGRHTSALEQATAYTGYSGPGQKVVATLLLDGADAIELADEMNHGTRDSWEWRRVLIREVLAHASGAAIALDGPNPTDGRRRTQPRHDGPAPSLSQTFVRRSLRRWGDTRVGSPGHACRVRWTHVSR